MNRIQTLFGSTLVAGALVATPVVLALSAGQSGAAPVHTATTKTLTDDNGGKGKHNEPGDDHGRHGGATAAVVTGDDKGGKGKHNEPGDDKGGKGKHNEPGDDHGRHGGGEGGDDHGHHGSDG